MKLNPRQVRLLTPFLPSFTRRRLRFSGKRNAVQLQETALVVEGDLLRFHYLGFERFFAGAVSEWTTVTIPYSRITKVRYRAKLVIRLLLLMPVLGMAAVIAIGALNRPVSIWESLFTLGALALPVVILSAVIWRGLGSTYTIAFRSRDGRITDFTFRLKSRALRKQFNAALATYRDAAHRFTREGR